MFRFRIGPIPVLVHLTHFFISGWLALSFAQYLPSDGAWPASIIGNPNHPQNHSTLALATLLWLGIISLSVLVHELGHAVSSRWFGYDAFIQLVGLGGTTQTLARDKSQPLALPWHEEFRIVLAGPVFGFTLGALAKLVLVVAHPPEVLAYVLQGTFWANTFWAVLNLMPVAPLDGGTLSRLVLMRVFGRRGYLLAQLLTLLVAGFAVTLGVLGDNLVLALLFSLYGFRAIWQVRAYARGEAPGGLAAHPAASSLLEAEAFAAEGKLDESERLASSVLLAKPPAALASRAHAVLGWVLVKRGNGLGALVQFKQADEGVVPPQAWAAAYSLGGDEATAIPLWEKAAASGDSVIRHEYAGALIRAGRELEARRLPELRLALAFAAAERVHFLRREYAQAATMAEASFREEPTATAAYDAACAWALASDHASAMRCLVLAAQNGFKDAQGARGDPDLKSLRGTPEFEQWLTATS